MYRFIPCALLIASPAFAATTAPQAISIMDPIGTGCIDGGGYDDPFPSSKGVRAPAFCLPNPCDRALTRAELSRDIIGRQAETWEWDAYYSRYAEICRAEAINAGTPQTPTTPQSFWAPLIAPPLSAFFPAGPTGTPPSGTSLFTRPDVPTIASALAGNGGIFTSGTSRAPTGPAQPASPSNIPDEGNTPGEGNTPDSGRPPVSSGPPAGSGSTPQAGANGPKPPVIPLTNQKSPLVIVPPRASSGGAAGNSGGGFIEQPPVIPLPAPLWMLLGSLAALLAIKTAKPARA